MSKYLRYFFRALALVNLITMKLPQYTADGKITVAELGDFAREVFRIGGWSAQIEVPKELTDAVVGFDVEK